MTPLFKKLNLGTHESILAFNVPESFEMELEKLDGVQVKRKAPTKASVIFGIGFAITQSELDSVCSKLVRAADGDSVIWVAYPKGTSKKYKCEFNRDSGWTVFGEAGYETVRMVAIDEDWSALRFRRVEHIGSLTRSASTRISQKGKSK